MTLITDKPQDIPSGNDLDNVPDDLLEIPPAYLTFGATPAAMEEPPAVGDVRTYIVRARCTAEHGPIERKDGEMRYTRTMQIVAAFEQGKKPTDKQPGLFDAAGDVNPDAVAADESGDDDEDQAAELDAEPADTDSDETDSDDSGVENPAFSHDNTDDE